MVAARTFLGFNSIEWAAILAAVSATATIVLVWSNIRYVRLTERLVHAATAGLPVEFDVVLTAFNWMGYPFGLGDDGALGPFPEQLRIENLGTRVFVHAVHFDGRRGDPSRKGLGSMVGPVRLLDPSTPPVSLARGEVLYGGFDGSWALQPPDQEVGATIEYSLTPNGTREEHTLLVRASTIRSLRWPGPPSPEAPDRG